MVSLVAQAPDALHELGRVDFPGLVRRHGGESSAWAGRLGPVHSDSGYSSCSQGLRLLGSEGNPSQADLGARRSSNYSDSVTSCLATTRRQRMRVQRAARARARAAARASERMEKKTADAGRGDGLGGVFVYAVDVEPRRQLHMLVVETTAALLPVSALCLCSGGVAPGTSAPPP